MSAARYTEWLAFLAVSRETPEDRMRAEAMARAEARRARAAGKGQEVAG